MKPKRITKRKFRLWKNNQIDKVEKFTKKYEHDIVIIGAVTFALVWCIFALIVAVTL